MLRIIGFLLMGFAFGQAAFDHMPFWASFTLFFLGMTSVMVDIILMEIEASKRKR